MIYPKYISQHALTVVPTSFDWDTTVFNSFWATNYESNPRLGRALELSSTRAAFTLGFICCQWIIAHLEKHTDTSDALLRMEAANAAIFDFRYAKLTQPLATGPSNAKNFSEPLRLAMKLLAYHHEILLNKKGSGRSKTLALAMLAAHVTGNHSAFSTWLSDSLRRCAEAYPCTEPPFEQEECVPPEFFEPGFLPSNLDINTLQTSFTTSLNPDANPYLSHPIDMQKAGFTGSPYGRSV